VDLKLAHRLLDYARFLRRAVTDMHLDYSGIQAVSKWIVDSLKTCSPAFAVVVNHAKALESAISLSRGLGVTELWSLFLLKKIKPTNLTELEHLEDGVRDLKDISDIQRSSCYVLR
jgi:hypothetical protein